LAKIYHATEIKFNQFVQENVHDHQPADKAYLNDVRVTNISRSFSHKMAAETSWHRYGTKLRHCHPVYGGIFYRRGAVLAQYSYDPVSVHLFVTSQSSVETHERISWLLARRLPSTCFTLRYKEIPVPAKESIVINNYRQFFFGTDVGLPAASCA